VRAWIAVVAVAAVIVVGVVVLDHATNRDGDSVAVVGDSITQFGTGQLQSTLGPDFHLTIVGKGGKRSDELYADAVELAKTKPKQAIIELGTNDILQHVPISQVADDLGKIVDLFSASECVHVVNVNTRISKGGDKPAADATALDQRIDQLASDHHNVDVVDWNGMVQDSIDDDPPLGFIFDGVHPTADGQRQLADEYESALQDCGRPWKFW
jgi:lysophospholipase L1-like esterase